MDTGERIKYLRKEILKMTQQEFSDSINISRSNLANIETGKVDLTDRVSSDISKKHDINLEWLINGSGEIRKKLNRQQEIAKFTASLFKSEENSFKSRFIMALSELDESEWEVLENIANKIANKKD